MVPHSSFHWSFSLEPGYLSIHNHTIILDHLSHSQFSSVAQSCPTLCDPMDWSTPGFPAHHQLPELAQTHVHRVSDAIQPSHPLSSLSPPAFNFSQHQDLFQWVSSSHQVAKVLESVLGIKWPKYWSFGFSISPSNNTLYCMVIWTFFALPFLGIGMKTDFFQSCGHCWVF